MTSNKLNIFIFIVIIFELFLFNKYLFRPYDTPGQESLISFFAHQAAMSNWVRDDFNIFVAKILNCKGELVYFNEVSNWPNGFFYLFSFIIKIFGNYEIVGRVFALFLNLSGMYLFLKYSCKKNFNNNLFFSIPIIIASPIGLSSLNVVYPDSILILLIALLNVFSNYLSLYIIILFLTPMFYHIVLFFNFVHVIYLKINQLISFKQFILINVSLLLSLFYLFYVLSVNDDGFKFNKLFEKFLVRSFFPNITDFSSVQHEIGENVNFFHRTYLFYSLIRDNLSLIAFPFIFLGALNEIKKKSLLIFMFITTIAINYLFLQYFIVHYYSNLIFVFFSSIIMIIGVNLVLKTINAKKYSPIFLIFLLLININMIDKNLIYEKWKPVISDSIKLKALITTKVDMSANSFDVKNYKSDNRICGFYLLPIIIKNYHKPEKKQILDLNLL